MQGVIVEIDGDTAIVEVIEAGLVSLVAGKLVGAAGDQVRAVQVLTNGSGFRFRAPVAIVEAAGLVAAPKVPASKPTTKAAAERKPRTAKRRTADADDADATGVDVTGVDPTPAADAGDSGDADGGSDAE